MAKFSIILIFILGIFIRTKVFLINQSFWHDECALAWNILNKSYIELLNPLRFLQVAPPVFLILTKFLTQHFGNSENIFRLIPFIASLLSIGAFYFLTINIFTSKKSVFFANLMFALNFPMYYYATEFKPYSLDVLFCILVLLVFQKLNNKYFFIKGLFLSLLIWIAFPTGFFLLSGIIVFILDKRFNLKEKLLFCTPVLISWILFLQLYFTKIYTANKYSMTAYWSNDFLNWNNYYILFNEALKFIFSPSLLIPLLIIYGLFLLIKEKSSFIKISLGAIFLLILASSLKMYPFSGRLILFLIPIFIIYWTKPLDVKNIIILILFCVSAFPQVVKSFEIMGKKDFYKNNPNPREMMIFIKNQINPEDIIYINTASNSDFFYYKEIFDINNEYIIENFSQLNKGDKVWLFIPNGDSNINEEFVNKNFDIKYQNNSAQSFLIYGIKK